MERLGRTQTVGSRGWDRWKSAVSHLQEWTDVKAIACGNILIALRGDGSLRGRSTKLQTDKMAWCKALTSGSLSTGEATRHWAVVLKMGRVAWGDNDWGQCNTQDWTDIVAVAVGTYHTVGLKRDGTLVSTGANYNDEYYEDLGKYGEPYICWGQSDVEGWRVSMGTQPPDDLSCTPEQAIAQLEERQPLWSSLFSEPFDTSGGQPRDNLAAGETAPSTGRDGTIAESPSSFATPVTPPPPCLQ